MNDSVDIPIPYALTDNCPKLGQSHRTGRRADKMEPTLSTFSNLPDCEAAIEITKQKAGKPDWTLLLGPLRNALVAMVRVREFGNRKYSAIAATAGVPFDSESWRDNTAQDYLASAARHLVAACAGERVNEADGGCEHIAQAMIDLGFAYEIEKQGGPRVRK